MGKVRILNTKTGAVKHVEEHIANNEKLLKSYGFIKQDLGDKEHLNEWANVAPEKLIDVVVENPLEEKQFEPETFDGIGKELTFEEVKAKYTEVTGKKPGIKKQETLLKELQELETKQD